MIFGLIRDVAESLVSLVYVSIKLWSNVYVKPKQAVCIICHIMMQCTILSHEILVAFKLFTSIHNFTTLNVMSFNDLDNLAI